MDQINKPGLSRPKKKFNTTKKKKKRFYPSRTQIFDLSCAKKEVPTPSSQKKRFYFSRTKKRVDLSWTNIPAPLNKKGFSFSCAEIFNLSRTKSKSNLSRTNIQYLVQKKKRSNLSCTNVHTQKTSSNPSRMQMFSLSYTKMRMNLSQKHLTSLAQKRGSAFPVHKCSSPLTHKRLNCHTNVQSPTQTHNSCHAQIFNLSYCGCFRFSCALPRPLMCVKVSSFHGFHIPFFRPGAWYLNTVDIQGDTVFESSTNFRITNFTYIYRYAVRPHIHTTVSGLIYFLITWMSLICWFCATLSHSPFLNRLSHSGSAFFPGIYQASHINLYS